MTLHVSLRMHDDGTEWPNDDGTPHRIIVEDDPSKGIVIVKHASGTVVTADGTGYDVTPDFISAPLEHHGEISHLIGVKFELEGHPLYKKATDDDFDPEVHSEFKHECTDHCVAPKASSKRKAR